MNTYPPVTNTPRMSLHQLLTELRQRFQCEMEATESGAVGAVVLNDFTPLLGLSRFLFWERDCSFGGLVVEQRTTDWELRYLFLAPYLGWIELLLRVPLEMTSIPSISSEVHAADWHEREAADLFGLNFVNHPRLGDFVLHGQFWEKNLAPFRSAFDIHQTQPIRPTNSEWKPLRVVGDTGAFAMPIGPVYEGGIGESIHFLLETVGEDVLRAVPRLFFNFRAVEKIAEGQSVSEALLLAERFAATSSFAHSLAFSNAVERICGAEVPERGQKLRVLLAELERLRHHSGAITGICESTALTVSAAQSAIIEERLLRASCSLTGHRYLFGLNCPGGLRRNFVFEELDRLTVAVDEAGKQLRTLADRLFFTSSFLDRLEEVGMVNAERARDLNLLGPVGRASARGFDLRRECPYGAYEQYDFEVAREHEGDGFARLRVLFAEAYQSIRLIHQVVESLADGPVLERFEANRPGMAIGWTEAPIGAAIHWVRLDASGRIERYRAVTPSFNNWLGFHAAVEDFAFQDFPIILATFGLSATECDR